MRIITVTDKLEPFKPLLPLDHNKVEYIILHHVEAKIASWETVNKWHKSNGWNCFGYNEYILKNGDVIIGRGDNIGAQCQSYNSRSYGIAVEGNYGVEEYMPQAQFESLIKRIRLNKERFPNYKETVPHERFYPTLCPGRFFPMSKVLIEVNRIEDAELNKAIYTLYDKGIIQTPSFWTNNAYKGKQICGEYANLLIKNMARQYVDIVFTVKTVEEALGILIDNGLEIDTPDYWLNNAVDNGVVEGEYINKLIKLFATMLEKG